MLGRGNMDEFSEIAEHRFQQYETTPAVEVDGQIFFIGPRGLGTEDPDTSHWCTHCPATCEMIVQPDGTTRASRKYTSDQANRDYPVGTCMILPPDRCRHVPEGTENWEGWYGT
jgi:hypothetical protein